MGILRAAHTKQDPFPTYLGQEVSSVSEILNEGGFHLICHCSPLCAQGNPPSHHMNPTGTERQSQAATASGYPDPLLMEKGARLGEQTQKGLRGAISPAGGTTAASKLPATNMHHPTSIQRGMTLNLLPDKSQTLLLSSFANCLQLFHPEAGAFLGSRSLGGPNPACWASGVLLLPRLAPCMVSLLAGCEQGEDSAPCWTALP